MVNRRITFFDHLLEQGLVHRMHRLDGTTILLGALMTALGLAYGMPGSLLPFVFMLPWMVTWSAIYLHFRIRYWRNR